MAVARPRVLVAFLIYRSVRWLDFVVNGIQKSNFPIAGSRSVDILAVPNDAAPEVIRACGRLHSRGSIDGVLDHRSENPDEYVMARIYRAWNAAVQWAEAGGYEFVVLMNSDMIGRPGWVDELIDAKLTDEGLLPTCRLIESERLIAPEEGARGRGVVSSSIANHGGRLRSAMPETVHDLGSRPEDFDWFRFVVIASELYDRVSKGLDKPIEPGKLFMPVLLRPREWRAVGGYPIQAPADPLAADAVFFRALHEKLGLVHATVNRSIAYHFQVGESCDVLDG